MTEQGNAGRPEIPLESGYSGVENLEVLADAVNYNRFLIDLITANSEPDARVIDFGAGAGTFAAPLVAAGMRVTCVEPDGGLRLILESKELSAVASLDALDPNTADYVYTLNVLEHIENDVNALRELNRVLRPGGRLFVYVPAFQVLYTSMDRRVGHHRRYRLPDLITKIQRTGFRVTEARYADSLGFGATLLYRIMDRGRGDVSPRGLRLFDRYVFPFSRQLDRLTGRYFGKNAFVVAVKEGSDDLSQD
jgi:SAM-dependent methyltransferase